jgi:hypothetical protein
MSPISTDGRPLQQWLNAQPRQVDEVLARARRLAEINRSLTQWSDEPWLGFVRVANVRAETVVLFSSSAAALVPLRYRSQDLLAWLNEKFQLDCTKLETKVRPDFPCR